MSENELSDNIDQLWRSQHQDKPYKKKQPGLGNNRLLTKQYMEYINKKGSVTATDFALKFGYSVKAARTILSRWAHHREFHFDHEQGKSIRQEKSKELHILEYHKPEAGRKEGYYTLGPDFMKHNKGLVDWL